MEKNKGGLSDPMKMPPLFSCRVFMAESGEVKAIKVHDLVPGRNKVVDEFFF